MRVTEMWRYPVKSLLGERVPACEVGPGGLTGDRAFALHDAVSGVGLTARREPELLFASARLVDGGRPEIVLPDATVARDDAALSGWLGRPVTLRAAAGDGDGPRRYEAPGDFEAEAASGWYVFEGAPGPFHDSAQARVSILSMDTAGAWDQRRFRANLIVDGSGEDGLVGRRVTVGGAALDVTIRIPRCVMTTRAQAGGVERDLDVLRVISRERDRCLAVGATVARAGRIREGDEVVAG